MRSLLSFIDAEWDYFLMPFQDEGAQVTYGEHLVALIAAAGPSL